MDSVSLTAEEDEVIMVRSEHREKTLEEWSLSLLGRFHTTELINFRAAENHLSSVWKMEGNDLKITDLRDGVFLFRFSTESQLKWVIDNGPWSFDNHILLLRRWEKGMTASSVNFQTVPMWVQVWELPFDLINEEAGRDIGQGIGRVIEVDCKAIASFLRVRVEVPLDKPIRRGAPVLNPEGDTVRVVFKYERLCGLCFHCGLLGHEAKACKTTKLKVGEESPYGEWLRATEDHGIDGAEAEPLPNFNSGNGHSYHSTTHSSLVKEANPSNTNNEDLITTFCEIASSTREEALFFLESHNFHLDSAVSTFLDININPAAVAHPIIPSTVEVVERTEIMEDDGKNPENNMLGKSSSWSELIKWLEQKLDCFDPKLLLSQGYRRLCDAFRLLLTDLKERVVSLASDKAVWDVNLWNMSLRDLLCYAVNYERPLISNEEPDLNTLILMWILDAIKAIVKELIEKFVSSEQSQE